MEGNFVDRVRKGLQAQASKTRTATATATTATAMPEMEMSMKAKPCTSCRRHPNFQPLMKSVNTFGKVVVQDLKEDEILVYIGNAECDGVIKKACKIRAAFVAVRIIELLYPIILMIAEGKGWESIGDTGAVGIMGFAILRVLPFFTSVILLYSVLMNSAIGCKVWYAGEGIMIFVYYGIFFYMRDGVAEGWENSFVILVMTMSARLTSIILVYDFLLGLTRIKQLDAMYKTVNPKWKGKDKEALKCWRQLADLHEEKNKNAKKGNHKKEKCA